MKKSQKLLRKLLSKYRDELIEKPFTKERSSLLDCVTILIETIDCGQKK